MYGRYHSFKRPSIVDYTLVMILLAIILYSVFMLVNSLFSHKEPCNGYIVGEVYEPAHQQAYTGSRTTYDEKGNATSSVPYTYYIPVSERFIFHLRLDTGEIIRAETSANLYYTLEPDQHTPCTVKIGLFSGTPVGYTIP